MKAAQRVGVNIAKYRKIKGMTQAVLAEKASITIVYISRLENKKENPSVAVLERICKALGIKLAELFEGL